MWQKMICSNQQRQQQLYRRMERQQLRKVEHR
jgi:hypothetical protein